MCPHRAVQLRVESPALILLKNSGVSWAKIRLKLVGSNRLKGRLSFHC